MDASRLGQAMAIKSSELLYYLELKMKKIKFYLLIAFFFATCTLTACGGGGDATSLANELAAEAPTPSLEIINTENIPEKIFTNQPYNFSLRIKNPSSENVFVDLTWSDGSKTTSLGFGPGEHTQTYEKKFDVSEKQSFSWAANLHWGAANEELGTLNGSVEVEPLPSAPVLKLLKKLASSIVAGTPYTVELVAIDTDEDLVSIDLKWSDLSSAETSTVEGAEANSIFARNFSAAKTYQWTAVAKDVRGNESETLSGSVKVTAAPVPVTPTAPALELANAPSTGIFTQSVYEVIFNATDKDGDLKSLQFRWADENSDQIRVISTAAANQIKFSRTFSSANTYSWTAYAVDASGRRSNSLSGQVKVSLAQAGEDFPLPTPKTLESVQLLAPEECSGSNNGFFPKSPPNPEVEKRRRYVFDQFLVAKADKSGYDPEQTFNKHTGKAIYKEMHAFGLIAIMFNQMKLTTDVVEKEKWRLYTNKLAREATPPADKSTKGDFPFRIYQIMDTYARWNCEMEPATKSKVEAFMRNRDFGVDYFTTQNLSILNAYSRYMAGLFWTGLKDMNKTDPTGIERLKSRALMLYKGTSGEWASAPYDGYNTFVHMSLAQLSPDRELATLAHLGFQAATVKTASVWMRGILATFSLRDYGPFKTGPNGGYAAHWFFLGGKQPGADLSRSYLTGAAANYHMPQDITAVANKKNVILDTKIKLTASRTTHSQSYIEKDFGVFSLRSATRDGSEKSFIPGQTTPPGVLWSPKMGRANFWLTLTDDEDLSNPSHGWGNTPTNFIHAKYGQQWLQNKGTLILVTDSKDIPADQQTKIAKNTSLQNIFGSMPDPNSSSLIDTTCAKNSCKLSVDGKPVYQLFYSRDNKVLISISSSRPFSMFGIKRSTSDWLNEQSFKIPLDITQNMAAGVAIETADYASHAGGTMAEKVANFKKNINEKSSFKFSPPSSDKRRSNLEYKDRLGNTLMKEYIWSGNAPYWRLKGWYYSKNPDPRPLEIVNGEPVDHTTWPAIENSQVVQQTVDGASCPLYVKKLNGTDWLKLWDDKQPPYTPKSGCKAPA
jgi:hypothetical protein